MKSTGKKVKGICKIDGLDVTNVSDAMLAKIIAREIRKETKKDK